MNSIEIKYPRFRKLARKVAQIIWWTVTLQLHHKIRGNKVKIIDQPHYNYLYADLAVDVPLQYVIEELVSIPKLAVVCHMYYEEMTGEFKRYLLHIPFTFDLYISTETEEKKIAILHGLKDWDKGKVEIKIVPNRGRDIAAKLVAFDSVYDQYEFVLQIHSKKSPYGSQFEGWREYLLETLIGSPDIINSVFEIFLQNSNIGIIAPQHFELVRPAIGWGYNFKIAKKLSEKLNIPLKIDHYLDFPSGSMFWARTKALKPLRNAKLSFTDFPDEENQQDGTIAHAIERLFFHVCEKAGLDWIKIAQKDLLTTSKNRSIVINSKTQLYTFFENEIIKILDQNKIEKGNQPVHLAYLNSEYKNQLSLKDFKKEIQKLAKGETSLIDFNESFYSNTYPDIAHAILRKEIPSGYIHYCLHGKTEGRIWSNNDLTNKFNIIPKVGVGHFAPVHITPHMDWCPDLSHYPKASTSWLLIFFFYLQEDLFFAGYTEFFRDFEKVFRLFDRVTIAVVSTTFDAHIAQKKFSSLEVIHVSKLPAMRKSPHVIVAFNQLLFHRAILTYNNPNHTVYYCQDHEAGFFPYSMDYILAEQAITNSKNLIISTEVLKGFFEKKGLLSNSTRIFITTPTIDTWKVNPIKSKKLFFYFRPESFQSRNLASLIYNVVIKFCEQYSGYEVYLIGTIATSYSYSIHGNKIYVLNKLPYDQFVEVISSVDLVVSLIYSAHPGVVAYQSAASGIPTITNTFENRNASMLKSISSNIIPYDAIRDDLFSLIQSSLDLPKGNKSFNQKMYGSDSTQKLDVFIKEILEIL